MTLSPASAQKVMSPRLSAGAGGVCETGVAEAELDAGGVRARLYNIGGLFWRGSGATYEVPKGSGVTAMFASGLWLGGLVDGELRFAGSTYGPWEYWPGPLDAAGEAAAELCGAFDRIWVVTTADLAAYHDAGTLTADLAAWPVGAGAPFFVDVDGDGQQGAAEPTVALRPGDAGYDPARAIDLGAGERPVVFGAQTAWWVMNDRGGEHGWSETSALGIEVRATAWTLADADRASLYRSTFYRYEVLNRSPDTIDDLFAGIFADGDLGNATDDYVHSDSTRSMLVFYNGDGADESYGGVVGYGVPPALGIDILSGGFGAMTFSSGGTVTSDPGVASEAYTFMQTLWKDGTPLKVGGDGYNTNGPRTRWAFSGDPVTESFWTEENTEGSGRSNNPSDRRAEISAELGPLAPGEETTFDIAFLFAQGADRLDSVDRLRGASDDAQAAYASGDLFRTVAATDAPPPPPAPTAAPTLLSPADGDVFTEQPAPFAWTAVDGATGYFVEISASPDFEDPYRAYTRETRLDALFGPPNRTDPSYWRVVPANVNSEGPPSDARTITLYRYQPGPLTYDHGENAFVEVVGPGGVDPCGPDAASTGGCDEVFGNGIDDSFNSTRDYAGTHIGAGTENTIGDYSPSEFEIRFTEEGSYAFYMFTTGRVIPVPFEVWDVGQVAPGAPNDPTDDVQMVPILFADAGSDEAAECVFAYNGPAPFSGSGNATQRIYAYYAVDDAYAAFEAAAAADVAASADACAAYDPATEALIDFERGRPIQRFALVDALSGAGLEDLEGTVIRFYTADRLPVAAAPAPPAGALRLAVYPNPATLAVTVSYRLAEAGPVQLRVLDVLGREVSVLAEGDRAAGEHRATLETAPLAPGVYVVVLDTDRQRAVQTMTVAR